MCNSFITAHELESVLLLLLLNGQTHKHLYNFVWEFYPKESVRWVDHIFCFLKSLEVNFCFWSNGKMARGQQLGAGSCYSKTAGPCFFRLSVKRLNWCQSPRDKGLSLWNAATQAPVFPQTRRNGPTCASEWGLSRGITIPNDVWDDRN